MRLIDADALEKRFEYLETFENDLVHKVTEEEKGMRIAYHLAKYETHVAPTIDTESLRPQWIPFTWRETTAEDGIDPEEFPLMACGELPENGQDILVTNGDRVWSDTFWDDAGLYLDSCIDLVEYVEAWMPLPEPYTAKVEDDDNARRVKPLEFDRFKNDTLKDAQPTTPAHWEKADIPLPYQMRTVPTPSGTFAHREMYVCSACDGYNDKNTQYCPHCGAKMDRKDGNG